MLPGIVNTSIAHTVPGVEHIVNAATERMRVGSDTIPPEKIFEVVAFLARPGSDLMQGQTIIVDGVVPTHI